MTSNPTREILERLPPALLREYHEAWGVYQTACMTKRGTDAPSRAYEHARRLEDELQAQVSRVAAELRAEKSQ